MSDMTGQAAWYAVHTKSRDEVRARTEFERQGFEVYLPMVLSRIQHARKLSWQSRPFLPGYLFLHLARDERRWTQIRSTYGAIGAVHFGSLYPSVPDAAIEMMRSCEDEKGLIETASTPLAPFAAGAQVKVCSGSLAGLEGIFREMRGRDRAVVFLDWLGRQMNAEVPVDQLTAA